MKRKPHSTSLVLLLVVIFTFWWGISVLAQRDVVPTPLANTQVPLAPAAQPAPLVVDEQTAGGTHTYSGTYIPRSACDSFGSGIKYSAANGGHVSVILITDTASTACAQAAGITSGQPFSVSIKLGAYSNPTFDGVLLNGEPIPSQLIAGAN